jgi:hypothetical protein
MNRFRDNGFIHYDDGALTVHSGLLSVGFTTNSHPLIELSGVLWYDFGKPDRIVDTLRRIGKSPSFPLVYGDAGQTGALIEK